MPTMDEMFELKAQIDGDLSSADRRVRNRAKKIGRMHRLYGAGPEGRTCHDCRHFFVKQYASRYAKCARFGNSGGPATDWQHRWPACGKFEARS